MIGCYGVEEMQFLCAVVVVVEVVVVEVAFVVAVEVVVVEEIVGDSSEI